MINFGNICDSCHPSIAGALVIPNQLVLFKNRQIELVLSYDFYIQPHLLLYYEAGTGNKSFKFEILKLNSD